MKYEGFNSIIYLKFEPQYPFFSLHEPASNMTTLYEVILKKDITHTLLSENNATKKADKQMHHRRLSLYFYQRNACVLQEYAQQVN